LAEAVGNNVVPLHTVGTIDPQPMPDQAAGGGGGGGGGGFTVDAETQRYVDKSMDAVKAQNDARFSDVIARLDGLKSQYDHAPTPLSFTQFLVGAVSVAGVVLALVFSVLAIAGDRFDGGLAADAIKDQIAVEQLARDKTQDAKLDQILKSVLILNTDKKLEP
jgi:hypothetical protein